MIFSLQKRFLVFLLLPVVLIVLVSGVASFLYARSYLLDEWKAMTKLRLEWTAHQIRMRLDSKRELINLVVKAETTSDSTVIQAFLTQQLSEMPGVRSVELQPLSPTRRSPMKFQVGLEEMMGGRSQILQGPRI